MILQALTRYYEILAEDPDSGIAPFGYSTAGVSFALILTKYGELEGITRLFQNETRGKKLVEIPLRLNVPEQVKRAGTTPLPNFLWDNSAYVLGISEKDKEDLTYAARRFEAFRDLHLKVLDGVDCPEARAVKVFLTAHDQKLAREHPVIAGVLDDLLKGGNLVFKLEGCEGYVHDAYEIRRAWERYKAASTSELTGQCLVTGEVTAIARLHPNLKGVRDSNQAGASLVGFNAPAYESYGRKQGLNAQTSEKAVFEYGTALNYLLSSKSKNPKFHLGDTTVVFWSESPNKTYADLFSLLVDPAGSSMEEVVGRRDPAAGQRLREIAQRVKSGGPVDTNNLMQGLDPDTRFYVLGLAPNVARVAVRFFHCDMFARLVTRIMAHYDDLQIVREFDNQPVRIPVWQILNETVSKKARDKDASPLMSGALMRAILEDTPYPAALFYAMINRIRADADDPERGIRKINYVRAAVIKAYLTRKYRHQPNSQILEVLCMPLNEQSTYPAYLMGRLFAVLEKAQEEAIANVNASIKDRFFSSACASPVTVFPRLLRLSQHHIVKLSPGRKVWLEKILSQIMSGLEDSQHPFPAHLSLDDQGVFVLGYYHQRADFFKPKNGIPAVETNENHN